MAKEILRYENMPQTEKYAYDRYVENRRIEMGVLETAKDQAQRELQIKVALSCLEDNLPLNSVVKHSGLLLWEVQLLAEGKDIDDDDAT